MSSYKHIILTTLFEFGGSNSHLSTLIEYFDKENIVLAIEENVPLHWFGNIKNVEGVNIKVIPDLHKYAHLVYPSVLSNIKESFKIAKSILKMLYIGIRYNADITISAVEPEKYLYFLWIPFVRVIYILHSTPEKKFTRFTTYTCNARLGRRKRIITVSNANKRELCNSWDITPNMQQFVHVVYNCHIKKEDSFVPVTTFNPRIKHVVTMGHVIAYKNPHIWLEVAKQVTSAQPGVHFTWLGNGPLLDYFTKATQDTDQINFIGFKANTDDYLATATLYYQPSTHETHGIAVVEAMSSGLPCVVADAGGLPESVKHNYNGLVVDPHNIDANVKAITNLINDHELLYKFGSNSYTRYLDLFTFKKFKLMMDGIYNN